MYFCGSNLEALEPHYHFHVSRIITNRTQNLIMAGFRVVILAGSVNRNKLNGRHMF